MVGPEDLTNAGETIEVAGQAWTFSHVGPAIRGAFSSWLKGRARQELSEQRQQGIIGSDQYREDLSALTAEFAAGSYSWGSPRAPDSMGDAVAVALRGTEGQARLMQLLLEPKHGAVTYEQIRDLNRANPSAVGQAVAACIDPNRRAPTNEESTSGTKTNTGR